MRRNHDERMRTTIEISESDHALFKALTTQRGVTLGEIMVELAKASLDFGLRESAVKYRIKVNPKTGLPVLYGGSRIVASEEVKKYLDNEQ